MVLPWPLQQVMKAEGGWGGFLKRPRNLL